MRQKQQKEGQSRVESTSWQYHGAIVDLIPPDRSRHIVNCPPQDTVHATKELFMALRVPFDVGESTKMIGTPRNSEEPHSYSVSWAPVNSKKLETKHQIQSASVRAKRRESHVFQVKYVD